MISVLDGLGAREQTAVDRVHNRSSSDHPSVKVAAVESLDGVLSARNLVELEVDVALGVGVEGDVHDAAVLLRSFLPDFVLELLGPVLAHLPVAGLASLPGSKPNERRYVLGGIKHVVKHHTATSHADVDGEWLRLSLGLENLSLRLAVAWLVSSCQLPHEGVSAVVVKVDTSDVGIVQRTGTSALLVVSAAGAVEVGRLRAPAPCSGEGGSLELLLLILALESPQEVGS